MVMIRYYNNYNYNNYLLLLLILILSLCPVFRLFFAVHRVIRSLRPSLVTCISSFSLSLVPFLFAIMIVSS